MAHLTLDTCGLSTLERRKNKSSNKRCTKYKYAPGANVVRETGRVNVEIEISRLE